MIQGSLCFSLAAHETRKPKSIIDINSVLSMMIVAKHLGPCRSLDSHIYIYIYEYIYIYIYVARFGFIILERVMSCHLVSHSIGGLGCRRRWSLPDFHGPEARSQKVAQEDTSQDETRQDRTTLHGIRSDHADAVH